MNNFLIRVREEEEKLYNLIETAEKANKSMEEHLKALAKQLLIKAVKREEGKISGGIIGYLITLGQYALYHRYPESELTRKIAEETYLREERRKVEISQLQRAGETIIKRIDSMPPKELLKLLRLLIAKKPITQIIKEIIKPTVYYVPG